MNFSEKRCHSSTGVRYSAQTGRAVYSCYRGIFFDKDHKSTLAFLFPKNHFFCWHFSFYNILLVVLMLQTQLLYAKFWYMWNTGVEIYLQLTWLRDVNYFVLVYSKMILNIYCELSFHFRKRAWFVTCIYVANGNERILMYMHCMIMMICSWYIKMFIWC